ncbi:uncharacterized protein TNCV_5092731 [Trichonephila clavipes]|nr:uncharacterized protein TNCV_5092731 [Trichonephila clavipes]
MSSKLAVQDCLDSEGIQRLVWPARSPDLNPIENVWDALGRQVAGRNYPPTNKNTLIRALTEEWDKLPQQLLNNVVQSIKSSIENGQCDNISLPSPRCEILDTYKKFLSTPTRKELQHKTSQSFFSSSVYLTILVEDVSNRSTLKSKNDVLRSRPADDDAVTDAPGDSAPDSTATTAADGGADGTGTAADSGSTPAAGDGTTGDAAGSTAADDTATPTDAPAPEERRR